jgi:rhamnogalacturonan endolyase
MVRVNSASTLLTRIIALAGVINGAVAVLTATETTAQYILANDRLYAAVNKTTGSVQNLVLDGQDLLGVVTSGSGKSGYGPYLDCYCVPSGFYTPGFIAPRYKLLQGQDSSKTAWGGIVMSETYPSTGQVLEQYWFLRDGETGLHTFSRLYYYNQTKPFLRNLQEFRTLFRPNSPLWTNLTTNAHNSAPLPSTNATSKQVTVQDATWYLGNTPDDSYVSQYADYFTKYTFADTWRDHDVHGMYSDGTKSKDGSTFGAWLVMNTRDTYFGGPLHSDLVVDGIVYNYIVSNHHGDGTPNITDGFDRTFGPVSLFLLW